MWSGRIDSARKERFHQWVQSIPLHDIPQNTGRQAIAFIGFASDEGVKRNQGRPGAKEGPQAIRHALGPLPYSKEQISLYDIGDIRCEEGDLEKAQEALAEAVKTLHQKGILPIVLGGGHEVAWGHYQGIARGLSSESIAIVNFDAHLDMRPLSSQSSSGTPFLQIAKHLKSNNQAFHYTCIGLQETGNTASLMETADAYQVSIISAEEIHLKGIESAINTFKLLISKDLPIYVTICLDVFASSYAPGVSAPQPLGLTPWQVIPLLRLLANSGKVVSIDIAELAPPLDQQDLTAKLAASLLFDFIHHLKYTEMN